MTFVFNASPLIILAKAGLLDTVLSLPNEVIIPRPVAAEISRFNDPADAASLWLLNPIASTFLRDAPMTSDFITAWGLGAGESAVISLVQSLPGSTAVLDDLAARRCAGALRMKVVGTLGLLLIAKRAGHIQSVSSALDAIVSAGLFITPAHLAEIQRQAGE